MSATHTQLTLAILSIALNLAACGSDSACVDPVASRSEAIKVADGSLLPTASIEPLVLAVVSRTTQGPRLICTATRISAGAALTAKHCLRELGPEDLWLRSAADQAIAHRAAASQTDCASGTAPAFEQFPVLGLSQHDTLDLALLLFDEDPRVSSATLAEALPDAGAQLSIAGFGTTETFDRGALRALAVELLATTSDMFSVQAKGGGACTGDSGGPLYGDDGGRVVQFGLLSRGSASCYGTDEYVNIAAASTWLDAALAAPD